MPGVANSTMKCPNFELAGPGQLLEALSIHRLLPPEDDPLFGGLLAAISIARGQAASISGKSNGWLASDLTLALSCKLLPGLVALLDQAADMVDPHPLDLLAVVVAALLTERQGQAGELLFQLGDHAAQTIDIALQNVPFEQQERQILLLEIDNLVHFDTNTLTVANSSLKSCA